MADSEESRERGVDYPVNGKAIRFPDRLVTGREALTRAGLVPASGFRLIQFREGRTKLVGTDDDLDLGGGGELRAFGGDRDYGFSVDEVGQVWGAADMEVDEFLSLWPPRPGTHWTLEREGGPETVLAPGGVLSFGPNGVERVVSRPDARPDTVLVTIVTTAGTFPAEGAARRPASTTISLVLAEAADKLRLTGTADWIVTSGNRDVNATLTFAQAGLAGAVALEWGPREGGGGA